MKQERAARAAVTAQPPGRSALTGILIASLDALAASGDADAACRLAGQACAALRQDDPDGWRRFNALLHRLSRLTGDETFGRAKAPPMRAGQHEADPPAEMMMPAPFKDEQHGPFRNEQHDH